ncbi:MAG: hypothetical protein JSR90_06710 [Proteobacteria bacterium]|nr:hypothetical protein [Pseudomonadota bacterium]
MDRFVICLVPLLAAMLAGGPVLAADAASTPVPSRPPITNLAPKEHCRQLVAFYDRYGVSRSEHSDGAKNHFRIRAAIDCERGLCGVCVHEMEVLLVRKAFDIPAFIGPAPWYEPAGRTPLGPSP